MATANSSTSAPLEDRVQYYLDHPDAYTNQTYKLDPKAYTAVPIYRAFQTTYGRAPTSNEYAQYGGVQQAGGNVESEIANAFASDPQNIAKQKQQQQDAEAPKHYDAVNSLFQSQLGRQATQDELSHFGSLLSSGTTDPYQLQQFLQQQPEYQNQQNAKMRSDLSGTMASNDKRQFQEQILPGIQENFAKQGRSFDSSAFANSATLAAQQQNTNREGFLNNLTASQYGGVEDRAYQDYASQVQQQNALQMGGIQSQQQSVARVNNINDYKMQQDMYNQYLAKYGKRNNGIGGMIGGGIGAAAGAYAGGPTGAMVGYQMGSGLGNAAQNSYGGSY